MSDFSQDDIDFKPLSQGLGFHQKSYESSSKENTEFKNSSVNSFTNPATNSKSQKNQDEDQDSLTPVWMKPSEDRYNPWAGDLDIGREPSDDGVVDGGMENSTLIENPFYIPNKANSPVEVVTLRFSGHDGLRKPDVKPITGSLMAIIMDVLTLTSLSMIISTMVLSAQGKSISNVLMQLPDDGFLRSSTSGMILTLGFLYLVLARCFFGRTLGEWMMHLQLGSEEDQENNIYPIKVLVRTLFVFFSGFALFPVVSWLADRDLLAYFSGVEMHTEVQKDKASDK